MLVLSRFVGEKIIINGNIVVTVSGVEKQNKVRIGISAPNEISIHREEVYLRIKKEKHKKENRISDNTQID